MQRIGQKVRPHTLVLVRPERHMINLLCRMSGSGRGLSARSVVERP